MDCILIITESNDNSCWSVLLAVSCVMQEILKKLKTSAMLPLPSVWGEKEGRLE